ncbi:MAG TPA: RNase H family protein [Burkholderiaceae bacterium]|nr:RNase H family protein [Burkholderiaceae bacterium]
MVAYTDGSAQRTPQGLRVGAGIYVRGGPSLRIDPGGLGCTLTNNRAELVAIQVAIDLCPLHEPLTIYTDSACSIFSLRKMLNTPRRLRECKHRELLEIITQTLVDRAQAGGTTRLLKVRSHTGIEGNEVADRLAKQALTQWDWRREDGEQAHAGSYWPTIRRNPLQGARLASNLTKDIKSSLPTNVRLGAAPTTGLYATTWLTALPNLDNGQSHRFWGDTNLTWKNKMDLLRLRWGTYWTAKLAHRYRLPYFGQSADTPLCPLCRADTDGARHTLGGCRHPEMRAAYISRHNKAVQLLQRAA